MAVYNQVVTTTLPCVEDYSGLGFQFCAFALNDNKVANNGLEAIGILQNKPNSGDHATIAYFGESKFRAGGAISVGDEITVATSGYFVAASSLNPAGVVGKCKETVTSGSIGTGIFDFTRGGINDGSVTLTITAAGAISAGKAVALNDYNLANNQLEFDAIAPAAIASSAVGTVILMGKTIGTLADSYGPGQYVRATTSGYLTAVASGFGSSCVVLTGATSGSNAVVFFAGGLYNKLA